MRIFLLAALIFVVFGSGKVEAKEPEWHYSTQNNIDHGALIESVDISEDGEYIVAGVNSIGSDTHKIFFFNKDNATPFWSYDFIDYIHSVAISDNGEYIVVGSGYGSTCGVAGCTENTARLHLFDKDRNTPHWNYTAESGVSSVAISADGEHIVADDGKKITLFNKNSGTPLWNYTTGDWVRSVAISADGKYIAAGSDDNKIYFFNKNSGVPLWNYSTGNVVTSIAISADGEYIVVGNGREPPAGYTAFSGFSGPYGIFFFDKDSSTPHWNYTTENWVRPVTISADGKYITGSDGKKVYLFNKYSDVPLWNYTSEGGVNAVSISANGEYIIASSYGYDDNRNVYLFNKDSNKLVWDFTNTEEWSHSTSSFPVAISGDGKYIVAGFIYWISLFDRDFQNEGSDAGLPSISLIPALISIGLIAIYRRK